MLVVTLDKIRIEDSDSVKRIISTKRMIALPGLPLSKGISAN